MAPLDSPGSADSRHKQMLAEVSERRNKMGTASLWHAGPYPMGATYLADIPRGMNLKQFGAEMLNHGRWVLGGTYHDEDDAIRKATEEAEGDGRFIDFELFTLAPSVSPLLFALAVEETTAVRGHGDPYLVLTLYLTPEEGNRNLRKLNDVYVEAVKGLRHKADKTGDYPHGVVWRRITGRPEVDEVSPLPGDDDWHGCMSEGLPEEG